MYIFVTEDGQIYKTSKVPENDDLMSVDDGYLTIIDIGGAEPTEYHDGDWIVCDDLP